MKSLNANYKVCEKISWIWKIECFFEIYKSNYIKLKIKLKI